MSHSTLTDSLVSWWQMDDDPDAGIVVDSMGRMSLIPVNLTRITGQIDYALQFGVGARAYTASSGFTTMQNRSFSIMVWFKMDGESPDFFQYLVSKFPFASASGAEFALRYELAAFFHGVVGAVATAVLAHDWGIPVFNVWHMLVMSYDDSNGHVSLRMDDRPSAPYQVTTPPVASTTDFTLGADDTGDNELNGAMGPVGLWWRVLTNAEVDTLWNDGEWLAFEELSVHPCKSVACCDRQSFNYNSSSATDASQDLDSRGPPNPNCPDGYLWGGLSCVREQEPQTCSTGYYWNGIACVPEGDSVVCASGYFYADGLCRPCARPAAPDLVGAHNQITLNFNVAAGLSYNIFRSNDGTNYTLLDSNTGGGGVESYVDATVTPGTIYYYYISTYLSMECGFTDGFVSSLLAF